MQATLIVLLLGAAYLIGFFVGRGHASPTDEEVQKEHEDLLGEHWTDRWWRIKTRKERIITLVRRLGHVSNDDVQELLVISHSTSWRYLNELVDEGILVRKGSGSNTIYTL